MQYGTSLTSLSFYKCSRYHYGSRYVCDFKSIPRPHYCMGLILEGRAVFSSENGDVSVEKGDIIFVPEGSTYVSTWTGTPDCVYISAHFHFEPDRLFPHGKQPVIQKVRCDSFDGLKDAFCTMYTDFSSDSGMHFLSLSAFYRIISEVYPALSAESVMTDSRIGKALDYIEEHYKESLSVPALAAEVGMSPSHFYTRFREMTGESPLRYKNAVAIRHAERLLLYGGRKSIEEIAWETGFSSGVYFREVFKERTGVTPTAYRKRRSPEDGE